MDENNVIHALSCGRFDLLQLLASETTKLTLLIDYCQILTIPVSGFSEVKLGNKTNMLKETPYVRARKTKQEIGVF